MAVPYNNPNPPPGVQLTDPVFSNDRYYDSNGTAYSIPPPSPSLSSWTPEIRGATGVAGTYAASSATGHYIQLGKVIWFWGYVALTDKGSWTGALRVKVPLVAAAAGLSRGQVIVQSWANLAVNAVSIAGNVIPSSDLAFLYVNTAATATSRDGLATDINNNSTFFYSGFYQVV